MTGSGVISEMGASIIMLVIFLTRAARWAASLGACSKAFIYTAAEIPACGAPSMHSIQSHRDAIRGRSQLRRWEVIKMLGEIPGPWKMSSFAYGYMHREPLVIAASTLLGMDGFVCKCMLHAIRYGAAEVMSAVLFMNKTTARNRCGRGHICAHELNRVRD